MNLYFYNHIFGSSASLWWDRSLTNSLSNGTFSSFGRISVVCELIWFDKVGGFIFQEILESWASVVLVDFFLHRFGFCLQNFLCIETTFCNNLVYILSRYLDILKSMVSTCFHWRYVCDQRRRKSDRLYHTIWDLL